MSTENREIIQRTAEHVRARFGDDASGHDWWHIQRVWNCAAALCDEEKGDRFLVELGALLHDLDDWKFNEAGDDTPHQAKAWLESQGLGPVIVARVCGVIRGVSFKGAGVADRVDSLEGAIVQDADRLDAIGAVGIGRAFAFGGSRNRPMYDPDLPPDLHESFERYKGSKSATINHFYEKLLLLKDRMHTAAARRMAQERHDFMLRFLEQFMKEWEGR